MKFHQLLNGGKFKSKQSWPLAATFTSRVDDAIKWGRYFRKIFIDRHVAEWKFYLCFPLWSIEPEAIQIRGTSGALQAACYVCQKLSAKWRIMRCRAQWFRRFIGWIFLRFDAHLESGRREKSIFANARRTQRCSMHIVDYFENMSWKNLLFMQLTLMTGFIYYIVAFVLACARRRSCIAADKPITAQKLIKDDTERKSSGTQNIITEANGNFAHRMTMCNASIYDQLRTTVKLWFARVRSILTFQRRMDDDFRSDTFWMNNGRRVRVVWFDYWINGCVVTTDY